MIKLKNGYILEFLAASGALGFDGRGWPWEQPARWRWEMWCGNQKTTGQRWPQRWLLRSSRINNFIPWTGG